MIPVVLGDPSSRIDPWVLAALRQFEQASSTISPEALLEALLGVDGAGSLLDADFLDGHDSAYFQVALGFTPENVANKSTDGTLAANSDVLYPSQKAVKTYSDTKIASSALDTDGTLAANSDARVASQKATKTYVDAILAVQDAMVFKGVIDCSANPNYPAADRGHTYRVSVAGKIGGGAGVNVEIADILICLTDGTASGTQAGVGANWSIVQANLDGAVIGPASAIDSEFVGFDGATGKLIKAVTVPGLIWGLKLSNNGSDAVNDLDIATGVAADSGNAVTIRLASALTKQLDAAWAVGTNAGMRASGAAIANATYHIFLIRRPDTGVVDVAADTSATGANIAANTNANYTQIRRIGSILRESATIVGFTQAGDEFLRNGSVRDVNASNPGTAAVTRTLSVPTGIKVWAQFNIYYTNTGTAVTYSAGLSEMDRTDEAPTGGAAPLAIGNRVIAGTAGAVSQFGHYVQMRTNTSGQIRTRQSLSDASCSVQIATLGWVDTRGKDG